MGATYTFLIGLLAGAAIGIPLGPVGAWCMYLRLKRQWNMVFSIVLGGALGDLIVASMLLFLGTVLRDALSHLQFMRDPRIMGTALVVAGCYLFFCSRRVYEPAAPSHPTVVVALLIAMVASILHLENALTIGLVFTALGIKAQSAPIVLVGFFLGTLSMWFGVIETAGRFGEKRGPKVIALLMNAVCCILISAGIAQILWAMFI